MRKLKEDVDSIVNRFKSQASFVAKNTVEDFFDRVVAQCDDVDDDISDTCGNVAIYFLKGIRDELDQYFPVDMFMPDFNKAVIDLISMEGITESRKRKMKEGTFPRTRPDELIPITKKEEPLLGTKEYNALLDAVQKLKLEPSDFERDGAGVKNKLKNTLNYYTGAGQSPKNVTESTLIRRWTGSIQIKNCELNMEVAVETYKVGEEPIYRALAGVSHWEGRVLYPSLIKILESVGFEKAMTNKQPVNGNPDYLSVYGTSAFSAEDDDDMLSSFNDHAPITGMVIAGSIASVALKLRKLITKLELVNKSFKANDAANETDYYINQGLIADPEEEWNETFLYDDDAGDEIVRISPNKISSREKRSKIAEALLLYIEEIQEEVREEDPEEVDNIDWAGLEHWVDNYDLDYLHLHIRDFLQGFVDYMNTELANASHYAAHNIWVGTDEHIGDVNAKRMKKIQKMKANKERDDFHRYEAARRQILKRMKESATKNVSKNKR